MQAPYDIERLPHDDPQTAACILRVSIAAYQVEANFIGVQEFPPLRETVDQILESGSEFWGIRDETDLAAVLEVEPAQDGVRLSRLVVDPGYFRQGLGECLVRFCLEKWSDRMLRVSTAVENDPALRLYRKCGFESAHQKTVGKGIRVQVLEYHGQQPDETTSSKP